MVVRRDRPIEVKRAIRKRGYCAYCGDRLPEGSRKDKKYCSLDHKQRAAYQRRRERAAV